MHRSEFNSFEGNQRITAMLNFWRKTTVGDDSLANPTNQHGRALQTLDEWLGLKQQ
jgi:hypothetical protein